MTDSPAHTTFNVRIYGVLIENGAILVSDEVHAGKQFTKFPGGGLQFGEGTHDCLKREFMEEMQIEISIIGHFYTADFFQASAFDPTQQVISIYYLIESSYSHQIPVTDKKFDFTSPQKGMHRFRWIGIEKLKPEEFSFPIDQKVSRLLSEQFNV